MLLKSVGYRITFLEIGVLGGGSLFMWRDFLGKETQIIGVNLNPHTTKWRDYGFEVFIGDQSDRDFSNQLYS